jgi:hypothetical protein
MAKYFKKTLTDYGRPYKFRAGYRLEIAKKHWLCGLFACERAGVDGVLSFMHSQDGAFLLLPM